MSPRSGRLASWAGLVALAALMARVPLEPMVAVVVTASVVAIPLLGLLAVAASVPFGAAASVDLGVGALTPTPLLLAVVSYAWVLAALQRRVLPVPRRALAARVVLVPLLCLLAVQAMAAWRAPSIADAVFEVARWGLLAVAFVLVAEIAMGPRAITALVLAVLAVGAVEALWGARASLQGVGPESFAVLTGGGTRAFGSFGQPNPFGAYMNTVWPVGFGLVAAWALFGGQRAWVVAAAAGAGAVCGVGLVLSYSRGAWVGAAAAAVVMSGLLLARAAAPPVRPRAAAVAWVAAVGVLCLGAFGELSRAPAALGARAASALTVGDLAGVADAEVSDESFATIERGAHWQAALAMWRDRPWLGHGPGHYELQYQSYRLPRWPDALGHAHNMYLHALAETGLLGLAAFALFLGGALVLTARAAARPATSLHGALGVGVAGVVVAVAVHSLVDNPFVHDMAAQVGLLLGLVVAAGRQA